MGAFAQDRVFSFSGKVIDEETNATLPGVTFRVLNTSRGTVSGGDGAFRITLTPGEHSIAVSSVGYLSDTLSILMETDLQQTIRLKPSPVHLQEVLVVAEDPGPELIRKAIEKKREWMNLLQSYEFDAYTKQILLRDTAIASVTESYTRGYWRKEDGIREVIHQRRQTENIQAAQNLTVVGRILNFNEDEIRVGGYTFVGPTAPEALENYNYKLERVYESRGVKVYELRMLPKSTVKPLFEGTISIADSTYAVMRVNVKPNEAFRFPFVDELSVSYQQRFSLFNNLFWMPVDISIAAAALINFPGLSFPKFVLEHRSVLYEYRINLTPPDSLFELSRVTVDSLAAKFDSTFWRENQVLPFTKFEETAYRTLDSTQTLEKQFRPGGVLARLGTTADTPVQYLDGRFNRVEGLFLGMRIREVNLGTAQTLVHARAGYGFSDRVLKWQVGLTQQILARPSLNVGLENYRQIQHRPDADFYGSFLIGLGALLGKEDYRDYYGASGWRGFLDFRPVRWFSVHASYRSEREKSLSNTTDFSLFARNSQYRVNPVIRDGILRTLTTSFELWRFRSPRFVSSSLRRVDPLLHVENERSSPGLGSEFAYTRYSFVLVLRQPTFLSGLLFPPEFRVRLAGGFADGHLPPQRMFDLETRYRGLAPFGVLRGAAVKEFAGDRYLSAIAEHNFRSLPFYWLGVDFLEKAGIELIVSGGVARTWLRSTNTFVERSTDGWYKELGFGISRVLRFLRVDFTWKLGQGNADKFFFTLSLADIF